MKPAPHSQSDSPVILLTGFGPFPGVSANETARLVPALAAAARGEFGQYTIHHEILPTEWSAAPTRLAEILLKLKPVLSLHFGVAQNATGFRIECEGSNACRLATDARGEPPLSQRLIAGGPLSHSATVPALAIVERLRGLGLPAYTSNDAGGYLCNAILYHSLSVSRSGQNRGRTGFVHIPADLSGRHLTFDDALRGSLEIVKLCIEQPEG